MLFYFKFIEREVKCEGYIRNLFNICLMYLFLFLNLKIVFLKFI